MSRKGKYMTSEIERIILGGWLSSEHIDDIDKFEVSDFKAYPHVFSAIKEKGVADIVGIAKQSGENAATLAEMIKSYFPTFYLSAVQNVFEEKARKYIANSQDKSITEIIETLKAYNEMEFKELPEPAKNLVLNYWEELDERRNRKIVYTGLRGLDNILCGIRTKELTAVGARPAVGKSAFLLQVAVNMANQGIKVLYFPLEMSVTQTVERITAGRLGIAQHRLRRGEVTKEEWMGISEKSDSLYEIEKNGNFMVFEGVNDLGVITALVQKHKPYAVIIDQLEQLTAKERFRDKRERFSYMTNNLKRISMINNIAVLLACQVNRSAENSEPTLSNLKESGSIEEDSDNVVLLHRIPLEQMASGGWNDNIRPMLVIVAKQRSGATGIVPVRFIANKFTFYDTESGA